MKYVEWVHLLPQENSLGWGSELVELAQLSRLGVPISPSFVLSGLGVKQIFLQPSLRKAITQTLQQAQERKAAELARAAGSVQKLLSKTTLPKEIHREVSQFMDKLEELVFLKKGALLPLELRLHAVDGEDLTPPHWCEVSSWKDVEKAIIQLLLPLFTPSQLTHRIKSGRAIIPVFGGVSFRYSPSAELTGVASAYDSVNHDGESIVVEAAKGHSHNQHAHAFRFDRKSLSLLSKASSHLHVGRTAEGKHHHHRGELDWLHVAKQVARLVKHVQADDLSIKKVSWASQAGMLVVTGVSTAEDERSARSGQLHVPTLLVQGLALVPGRATGRAKCIYTAEDAADLQPGDVAVIGMVTAKDASWLQKASALVVETGTTAGIEAELATELGIVAVCCTHARQHIRKGQIVTVDGYRGQVHAGKVRLEVPTTLETPRFTATKILTVIEDPLHIAAQQVRQSDGIGLLRGEFLLQLTGLHPHEVVERKLLEDYRHILSEVLQSASHYSHPLPITYQLHDISEETRGRFRHEPNPKLGYRGSHRIIQEPELLGEELTVISDLYRAGFENVRILLPAVRTLSEVETLLGMIEAAWPTRELQPEIWVRAMSPALMVAARDLALTGVSGVLFDVPALNELIHGFDSANHQVGHHLTREDSAFLDALHFAIATCRSEGVATGIISEDESLSARVLEEAIEAGAQEVVIQQQDIPQTSKLLLSIEQRIMLDHARNHPYQEETNS
jgi:phosphoenolpyruvate synthase/pyruvate phosphate dikinase